MSETMAVIEKFYAAFEKSEWQVIRDCFAPDCMTVTPSGAMNVEQHEQFGKAFKAAFPAGRMKVKNSVVSGEWVAVEGAFVGRHEKDLVGPQGTIPAQGKDLNMPFGDFFRIRNGKIIEHNVYWDQVGMLAQLGAMPK